MKVFPLVLVSLFALPAGSCWTESAMPACGKLPAATDAGSAAACTSNRALLSCTGGGMTEICLAGDRSGCTVPREGCESKCSDTEYAMACHGGAAPEGCKPWSVTPGGVTYSCCACQ